VPDVSEELEQFTSRDAVVGRRKAARVAAKKIVVEIDPYSDRDRLSVA
jgi:hypothetical protein